MKTSDQQLYIDKNQIHEAAESFKILLISLFGVSMIPIIVGLIDKIKESSNVWIVLTYYGISVVLGIGLYRLLDWSYKAYVSVLPLIIAYNICGTTIKTLKKSFKVEGAMTDYSLQTMEDIICTIRVVEDTIQFIFEFEPQVKTKYYERQKFRLINKLLKKSEYLKKKLYQIDTFNS